MCPIMLRVDKHFWQPTSIKSFEIRYYIRKATQRKLNNITMYLTLMLELGSASVTQANKMTLNKDCVHFIDEKLRTQELTVCPQRHRSLKNHTQT